MAEVPACPSNRRVEQFLNGQLSDKDAAQFEQHLLQCDFCLQGAIAQKPDNAVIKALHARIAVASGPEKDAVMAWILERLRPFRSSGNIPAQRSAVTMATRPGGKSRGADPSQLIEPATPAPPVAGTALPPGLGFLLAPAQGPDELGRLGPYRILDILGKGGMGIVFLAEDPQLKRKVAIKALLPMVVSDNEARQRFLREAQATAVIENDHVIPIYQVGEERGIPYLVMPFLKGQTLDQWLAGGGKTTVAQILRLAQEIAVGLAAAHDKGLIHRDIKPSNIWLEAPSSRVKILDFGLAQAVGEQMHLTQTGYVVGTPAFMAPEQARAEKIDHHCDLFSLGVVIYRVSTGEFPFKGDTPMALMTSLALDMPAPVTLWNADLPQAFGDLVMQLLAKDPTQRPPSARAVVERIEAIKKGLLDDQTRANRRSGSPRDQAKPAPTPSGDGVTNPVRVQPVNRVEEANSTSLTSRLKKRADRQAKQRRFQTVVLAGLIVVGIGLAVGAAILLNHSLGNVGTEKEPTVPIASKPASQPKTSSTVIAGGKLPVKVFVLAGQNDMSGKGHLRTIDWLGKDPKNGSLLAKIKNPDGSWVVRDHVWVYYPRDGKAPKQGRLTVGFGQEDQEIGPELLFGQVLGDYFPNPILLIKITHGPWSLAVEGRPPSSVGPVGPHYQQMIQTVRNVMMNLRFYCPEYEEQGCEIAGFVWFQGWNDMIFADRLSQYEANLVNLIRDVRKDFGVPNLPVVIGEMGVWGNQPTVEIAAFRKAQAAATGRPEFKGNVILVKTSAYWDDQAHRRMLDGYDRQTHKWKNEELKKQFETMGSQEEFLYLGSSKIFALIGKGFGEAMKSLCPQK
jgi:serine/threonine protein kinase